MLLCVPENDLDLETTSLRLILVIKRLKSRLKEEVSLNSQGLTLSQLGILQNISVKGPLTASTLSEYEHITQQAIAQAITPLKDMGLIKMTNDFTDKRKTVINITTKGNKIRQSVINDRNLWLKQAIEKNLNYNDQIILKNSVDLLERLVESI